MEVVIEHKGEFRAGLLYLLCTGLNAVIFYILREYFVSVGILCVVVLAELLLSAGMLIKGKTRETLNAEGITVTSPLRTRVYSWHQIRQYGVDMVLVKQGGKVNFSNKKPVISVKTETGKLKLPGREDVLSCLIHYKGKPSYDKRL